MFGSILRGIAAGAAGTTALNATTYLDMAVRGRPSSSTPEQTVEKMAKTAGADIPGDEETRQSRVSGLGALMGMLSGTTIGAAYGAARGLGWRPSVLVGSVVTGLGAMVGSAAPMTAMKVTDPREWGVEGWVSDAVPHLAYGLVTAATYAATEPRRRWSFTRVTR
ncbi:hypothetical protein [Prauserella muralis]|uniref:Uncharacterized protein n=1 Tax=Prauserella muralis TaxID=588067 RepID=A0A2V4B7Q8_9PSEU|nr:hypothetical protein [Prauserella muralis]PXY31280.1 hypothetical protein BAY60_02425 [Prauserella muralis]TWE14411.1 hypothetical protein FHX69_6558 [Prauserella muralis]